MTSNTQTLAINSTPIVISNIATPKVRISATVPILVLPGDSTGLSVLTNGICIPAQDTERSFYLGAGNPIAVVAIGNSSGYVNFVGVGTAIILPNPPTGTSLDFSKNKNSMYTGAIS